MYEALAQLYDAIHSAETDDIPFVTALATQVGDPILDLGCGSGRLTLPLAHAGRYVVGVDKSAAMLAVAQDKLNRAGLAEMVQLVSADMTTLQLNQHDFKLALISHNTLLHFSISGVRSLLHTIGTHLAADGYLLIDIDNPFALAHIADQSDFVWEQQLSMAHGATVQQYARWRHDTVRQQLHVEWRYEGADSAVIASKTTYHYLYPHMLQLLMEQNRFSWVGLYGDYDKRPFDEDSERLIIVATRV